MDRNCVPAFSVIFLGSDFGHAVGIDGLIKTTSDGGGTWADQPSGVSGFLRDIFFIDASLGVIVGESGLILRSTDGLAWSTQSSGVSKNLVHVHFASNLVGLAVGEDGTDSKYN